MRHTDERPKRAFESLNSPEVDVVATKWVAGSAVHTIARRRLGDSPRTVLTELSRIHSADVVLPLAGWIPARAATALRGGPDPGQALLLQRLGLDLPQRLLVATSDPNCLIHHD